MREFSYVETATAQGLKSQMPFLPIGLSLRDRMTTVSALVDSGASVNVLPYSVGVALGAIWEQQPGPIPLSGNLTAVDARAIVLLGKIGDFAPIRLAFAWTKADASPVILGQTNFFSEFDVCFHQSRAVFEVGPKS